MKDAQQSANDLRVLLDSGGLPAKDDRKIRLLTFNQIGKTVRREWDERLKIGDLSPVTHYDYCILLNVVSRIFGDKILCKINRDEIENYRNELAAKRSNVSANKHLSVIKKVFNKGIQLKSVIVDPTVEILFLSEEDHKRNRFILPHELDDLVEASKQLRSKYYLPALIYLGAEHAASKQEALDLIWDKIDFSFSERGLITFFRTKNKRERTELLMPRTKNALISWRDHQKWMRWKNKIECNNSNIVFCRLDGTPLKRFDKAFKEACKIAGIENFHFHDLRHTFASNLLLSGASLKDVKEMIGHSDISMTDRYSHLTLTHLKEKQSQLADHYMNGSRVGET